MIPDAVAAVIAAVAEEHPAAAPDRLGVLVVQELRALGWHITAPPAPRHAVRGAA
ncbi:hypothetical protein ACWIG4_18140 [Streptomyces sp. NPDC002248]